MKNFKLGLAVISILGLAADVPAQTQAIPEATPRPKATEVPSARLTRKEILQKLQVTSEQRQLLRRNRAAYRKKNAELDGQLKVLKVELENEMEKPEPDEEKLNQIAEKIGDVQGLKISLKIKTELELEKKILTPQQEEQLKVLQGKENPASGDIF